MPKQPANRVTPILLAAQAGDQEAADQLLPLVYDELRKLARARMARLPPGQTSQPTALVHEAYLRLVDTDQAPHWNSRRHFFAAAAEAMRRILVEQARRKNRRKHGGGRRRVPLDQLHAVENESPAPPEPLAVPEHDDYLGGTDAR